MSAKHLMSPKRLSINYLIRQLSKDGLIDAQQAQTLHPLARLQEKGKEHALVVLAQKNLRQSQPPYTHLTLENLTQWLAKTVKLPYLRIDPLKIDVDAITKVMSYAFAKRHEILAIEVTPDKVTVAVSDPFCQEWENTLAQKERRSLRYVLSNPLDIARYALEFYTLSRSVKRASGQHVENRGINNLEQLLELRNRENIDANDQHVINIVDWLLQYAFSQRASDIHLEIRRETSLIRFRIDGVLQTVYQLPASVMVAVISRFKILGRMNVAEKRRPLDGRVKTKSPNGTEVEMRLSTIPAAFGEKLVIRIFDPITAVNSFSALGLVHQEQDAWHEMIQNNSGLILVTGPTGSGKTTTLYATLKRLATSKVNLCTIEDPIEMLDPEFNQIQVNSAIDLGFAQGVRALLRQDPDIIMIGEIRDRETAEMAMQAALTGHLVISTLHTNDACATIVRLLDLGIPSYLINATLICVLAQRLVRKLCPHCKRESPIDIQGWERLIKPWRAPPPENYHSEVGCLECRNTGFLGRIGMYELLPFSEGIKKLVSAQADVDELRVLAHKEGLQMLRINGAKIIATGVTTLNEVMRVAPVN